MFSFSCFSYAIELFGDDENTIWKGGRNFYVKYNEQDSLKFGKNNHPVELKQSEIKNALDALKFQEKTFLKGEVISSVFSVSQIKTLSESISKGLKNAKADQDIIFVLGGSNRKFVLLSEKTFVAGRVFYKEDKLNIIIGEFDLVRNAAFERVLDPSDQGEINYSFNFGKRTKKSSRFKESLVGIPGVEQKNIKGKYRTDWLVIDVKFAAESYIANKKKKEEKPTTVAEEELRRQSAQIAKQRREMRAEMARMRKEMEKQNGSSGGASAKSIEERIATLDQLLEKDLITQEEYNSKRKEILNDI